MSECKVFSFPDQGGAFGGGSAMEGAMLGSMMGNGGMGGANGMWNNPWWALIFLAAFRGNGGLFGGDGNGNGGSQARFDAIQEQLSTIQGQNALASAIQGGTNEVKSLASTLNCDFNAVQAAINAVQSSICQLGNQINLGQRDVITAVSQGDNAIISKLCDCCCENRLAICQQTNTLGNAINGVNTGVERGFSALGYALAEQSCQSRQNADANTRAVLAKLDAMEDSRKDREIATLTAQLTAANSRAERQSELAPIYRQLNEIACNQPPVKKICCPEQYVPVNTGINAMYGLIPTGCGNVFAGAFNPFGGFQNGFTNGF